MTYTQIDTQTFLAETSHFGQLSSHTLALWSQRFELLRYRMGQPILVREKLPTQLSIVYEGQVRLIGYDPRNNMPLSLKILNPGDMVGWEGLIRQVPCETVIASTDAIMLTLSAQDFEALLEAEPDWAATFRDRCGLVELFDLLGTEIQRQADGTSDLKAMALTLWPHAAVLNLPAGHHVLDKLDPQRLSLLSGGSAQHLTIGQRLFPDNTLKVSRPGQARIISVPEPQMGGGIVPTVVGNGHGEPATLDSEAIPLAPALPPDPAHRPQGRSAKFPLVQGRGPLQAPLACFEMLSRYWNLPFRRDVVRRIMVNQMERTGSISLATCGAIAELMGLRAQLVTTPAKVFARLQTPALIEWQGGIAVLCEATPQQITFAVPEQGLRRKKPANFLEDWGESGQVLLLETTKQTPQKRFNLGWFLPSVIRYRGVLIEVLIASFLVQLFALANPLGIQVIIDKVLVQNSLDTLNVLGTGLLIVAVFEALLGAFRTYLFVDTTNRIDMTLGSQVIDHLVRLPLGYFDRRPVGELSTRVNELENIRQFLTGTALTVVLDAVFSVVYIVVMVFYSWLLTLVALATVPLFALLTLFFAPIIRQQARAKAERNAQTQSHLVEVMTGIQTVKAQNIELNSRWKWQERYSRYVSAGFNAVITSTTAGAMSSFLNKLSGLLLLWVGAGLVLQQQLTLGELIAFRIIASYTTSPLLRLIQLWQNFQETALSLERLSDILDHPQEATEEDRNNIPLPPIQGAVSYRDLCFSFKEHGPMQLQHVNLEFAAGSFVGIVGQSGSGKSTLMKLLMRLYDPNSGQILVDRYDVGKVELYSLRSQIGMVLQDSLLFDGTIQENIALSAPEATSEEVVEAARVAYAHDFIMELDQGYNSRVGERGSALSGGQRQRISIARAVLQNPRLLILDEATSALDYNAERQVVNNLTEAFHDRTVFFITHRLKTLQSADVIVMMDQGQVAEQGTHEELMANQGRYYWLYQQQEAAG